MVKIVKMEKNQFSRDWSSMVEDFGRPYFVLMDPETRYKSPLANTWLQSDLKNFWLKCSFCQFSQGKLRFFYKMFSTTLSNELLNEKTVISVEKKINCTMNSTSYGHKLIWQVQIKKIPKLPFISITFFCNQLLY